MMAAEQAAFAAHLTKRELASRWRVTTRTIERKMRDGTAPAYVRVLGSRQALFPIPNVEAAEKGSMYISLAHERTAEIQREGEQKENDA